MGSELLISLLEIDHDKEPDWDLAQAHLDTLTDEVCINTILSVSGADEVEDVLPLVPAGTSEGFRAKKRIRKAMESVKEGWANNLPNMVKVQGHRTTILIAGDSSWGDSIDECNDMAYFDDSGCATAAGFLS